MRTRFPLARAMLLVLCASPSACGSAIASKGAIAPVPSAPTSSAPLAHGTPPALPVAEPKDAAGEHGDGSKISPPTDGGSTPVTDAETNPADLRSVLAKNRWRWRACHEKALATDPTVAGAMRVVIRIGESGAVVSSVAVDSDLPPTLTDCIVASFAVMKFSPPSGGPVTHSVPVTLAKVPPP